MDMLLELNGCQSKRPQLKTAPVQNVLTENGAVLDWGRFQLGRFDWQPIKFKSQQSTHYMYLHVNVLMNQINKILFYILIINVGKHIFSELIWDLPKPIQLCCCHYVYGNEYKINDAFNRYKTLEHPNLSVRSSGVIKIFNNM